MKIRTSIKAGPLACGGSGCMLSGVMPLMRTQQRLGRIDAVAQFWLPITEDYRNLDTNSAFCTARSRSPS
jgi:hypothetical protein